MKDKKLPKFIEGRLDVFDNGTNDSMLLQFWLNPNSPNSRIISRAKHWGMIDPDKTPLHGLTKVMKWSASHFGLTKFDGSWRKLKDNHYQFIAKHALRSVKVKYQTNFWAESYHSVVLDKETNEPCGFMTMWKNPETSLWSTFITQNKEPNAKHAFMEHKDIFKASRKAQSHVQTLSFKDKEYSEMIKMCYSL
mgnify:CR=1 FL=1